MTPLLRGREALSVNLPEGTETLSAHGSDWLWAVLAIYLLSFSGVLVLSFTSRESDRVFHYLFTVTLLVGAITYFAQASQLGWSLITQANGLSAGNSRQMFYTKYIYWSVSFPSAALALGLLANVSWTTILTNIACAWLWVLTYLAAAYTTTSYKWGFFAFGTFSWVILAMSTLNESYEAASRIGIGRDYIILASWTNIVWMLYPVAFGIGDGGNIIGVTSSFIFIGILDLLLIPVLTFAFAILSRKWDLVKLHLALSEHRYKPDSGEMLPDMETVPVASNAQPSG